MEDFLGMEVSDFFDALASWGYICVPDPDEPMSILVPVTNCIGVRYIVEDGIIARMEYCGS